MQNLNNSFLTDQTLSYVSDDQKTQDNYIDNSDNSTEVEKSWIKRTFGPMERGSLRSSIIALISCAMGSGLLAFPSNAKNQGIVVGVVLVFICAALSRLSMYMILTVSYKTGVSTFPGLVEHCLGRPFKRAFEFNIIFYMFGSVVCFQIIFATLLWEACYSAFDLTMEKSTFILISNFGFIFLNLPMSLLKDVYSLRYFVQLQLAVIAYIVVAMMIYLATTFDGTNISNNIEYAKFDIYIFGSFASTFFGFIAHQLILPLKNELQKASMKRMNKVCTRGVAATLLVYAIVMVVGYLTWLGATDVLIINNYHNMYFTVAKGLMAFALFFGVPLNINPMRLAILESIDKKDSKQALIISTIVVQVASGFLAWVYPNVKSGFGFLGGFLGLNMVVVVPCLMYAKTMGKSPLTTFIVIISTIVTLAGWAGAILSQIYKE